MALSHCNKHISHTETQTVYLADPQCTKILHFYTTRKIPMHKTSLLTWQLPPPLSGPISRPPPPGSLSGRSPRLNMDTITQYPMYSLVNLATVYCDIWIFPTISSIWLPLSKCEVKLLNQERQRVSRGQEIEDSWNYRQIRHTLFILGEWLPGRQPLAGTQACANIRRLHTDQHRHTQTGP